MKRIFIIFMLSTSLFAQEGHWSQLYEMGMYDSIIQFKGEADSTYLKYAALANFHTDQWTEATQLLNEALEFFPSDLSIHESLVEIYATNWNYPKAIKHQNSLTKIDSTNDQYWYQLGQLYQKTELFIDAFRSYTKSLDLNPQHIYARNKLVDLLILNKSYKQADTVITEGLNYDPTNVRFLLNAGKTNYLLDSFQKAIHNLNTASKQIDLPLTYLKIRGICLYKIDSFQLALKDLYNVMVKDNDHRLEYYVAMCHLGLKNKAKSAYHFEKALEKSYEKSIPLYCDYLGTFKKEEGAYSSSIEHYQEAYRRSNNPKFLIKIANTYEKWYKDKSVALQYYEKYLALEDTTYLEYVEDRIYNIKSNLHMNTEAGQD